MIVGLSGHVKMKVGVELLVNKPLLNVEQTKDVRMYIEEFILVDIWIHCCTILELELNSIGRMLLYIHSQQRNEKG